MTELITIKENSNPVKFNLGLELEGRSKFPNCYDIIQPAIGRDGRWITGLDELARSISLIKDQTEREAKRAEVRAERLSLEELTGYDLGAKSSYWDDFFIEINPKKPLDLSIPVDRIKYRVLIANKEVAPSLKDTSHSDYFNSKFYVSKKHEDVSDKVSKKKRKAEADAAMLELLKVPDRAILVGRYLSLAVNKHTPADNLFDAFSSRIEEDATGNTGFIDKFNSALNKTADELNIKLIFDDGVKFNVIRLRDGYYQRGNITYGKSIQEAIIFLSDIKNQSELLSVQDEVEHKKQFG